MIWRTWSSPFELTKKCAACSRKTSAKSIAIGMARSAPSRTFRKISARSSRVLSMNNQLKIYVGCSLTQAPPGYKEAVSAVKDDLRADFSILDFLGLQKGTITDVY